MAVVFMPAAIQQKALALDKSGAVYILLFAGLPAEKTTAPVMALCFEDEKAGGQ